MTLPAATWKLREPFEKSTPSASITVTCGSPHVAQPVNSSLWMGSQARPKRGGFWLRGRGEDPLHLAITPLSALCAHASLSCKYWGSVLCECQEWCVITAWFAERGENIAVKQKWAWAILNVAVGVTLHFIYIFHGRAGLLLMCKILLLSPRRSETPGRPHSWHSSKLAENQPDPSMMQISQGTLGIPWHQSYHSR